jgi:hypothetical protein
VTIAMSFQDALDAASEAGLAMDRRPNDATKARFHACWLNVRRTIHRDFPDHYGDPDDVAPPETIILANLLLVADRLLDEV